MSISYAPLIYQVLRCTALALRLDTLRCKFKTVLKIRYFYNTLDKNDHNLQNLLFSNTGERNSFRKIAF